MALNFGIVVSVDNMKDWRGIRENAGEANSMKPYVTNDETSF
jgi:hypothetical protein